MAEDKEVKETGRPDRVAVRNMHKTFLEALRHREQEILRFIAILAPALGGFVWLLFKLDLNLTRDAFTFAVGTVGVLLLLLVGAVYSLALGYNYRIITFQLAKLESEKFLNIRDYMLKSWPRACKKFAKRYRILWIIPWCTPPEVIKCFWVAFVIGIGGVIKALEYLPLSEESSYQVGDEIVWVGLICFCVALLAPVWFGHKIQKACKEEGCKW